MGKREQLLEIMEDAAKGETKATLRARIAALEAENARLRAELDEATVYMRNLLLSFVGEHFPDNDGWKPLGDLVGMLTQIDNASTIAREYKARIAALEAQLTERGKTEREIEYDVYSKIRLAFRRALSELPEIAPLEISRVLSSVHMRDEFLNEGKRLQRTHGTDAVAPRVEQECGAGAWLFMRNGILSALEATPPAPKVTDTMVEAGAKAAAARWGRTTIWEEDVAIVRAILTAAQEAGK